MAEAGRTRRQIASILAIAAVILAAQGVLRQIASRANPGVADPSGDAIGRAFDFVGAALLAIAAGFAWWLSKRDPGIAMLRICGAIAGAWLGAGIVLVFAPREPFALWLRTIAIAPVAVWGELMAIAGLVVGGAIGALLTDHARA